MSGPEGEGRMSPVSFSFLKYFSFSQKFKLGFLNDFELDFKMECGTLVNFQEKPRRSFGMGKVKVKYQGGLFDAKVNPRPHA